MEPNLCRVSCYTHSLKTCCFSPLYNDTIPEIRLQYRAPKHPPSKGTSQTQIQQNREGMFRWLQIGKYLLLFSLSYVWDYSLVSHWTVILTNNNTVAFLPNDYLWNEYCMQDETFNLTFQIIADYRSCILVGILLTVQSVRKWYQSRDDFLWGFIF